MSVSINCLAPHIYIHTCSICCPALIIAKSLKLSCIIVYSIPYQQEGTSLTTFLERVDLTQPLLLCIGEQKNRIEIFYVMVDQNPIPCKVQTSVAAFDELFKAHYTYLKDY